MVITCPECSTKFRLDDAHVPEKGAKVRCSKCQHVFQVQKPAPPPEPPSPVEIPLSKFPNEFEGWMPKKRPPRRFPFLSVLIVIFILAGVGYGALLIWERFPELEQAGISFSALKHYLSLSAEKEGFIALEKLKGYYLENAKHNKIFVVEGQAVNHGSESRSFIKVKGTLLDPKGAKVEEKMVYCGNILSEKDLKEMSKEAMEKSLSSQFGISFSNVNIQPSKFVPFMIVFVDFAQVGPAEKTIPPLPGKPKEVLPGPSDFTVEVVSSQKGAK